MGNICSRSSNKADPFTQPGRVLGADTDAQQPSRASIPAGVGSGSKQPARSGGRTLGGGGGSGGSGGGGGGQASAAGDNAARAAEERAARQTATASKGKLSSQLAAQRAQTQSGTLNEASRNERATRDADSAATTQRWD